MSLRRRTAKGGLGWGPGTGGAGGERHTGVWVSHNIANHIRDDYTAVAMRDHDPHTYTITYIPHTYIYVGAHMFKYVYISKCSVDEENQGTKQYIWRFIYHSFKYTHQDSLMASIKRERECHRLHGKASLCTNFIKKSMVNLNSSFWALFICWEHIMHQGLKLRASRIL